MGKANFMFGTPGKQGLVGSFGVLPLLANYVQLLTGKLAALYRDDFTEAMK